VARRPQHGLRRDATATFCGVAALEDVGVEAVEGLDAAVLGVGPAGFPDGAAHVLGGAVGEGNTEGFLRQHALCDHGGETVGHEPGFPGARRGQYQERAIKMAEDGCLLWVGVAHGIGEMLVSERSQITDIGW